MSDPYPYPSWILAPQTPPPVEFVQALHQLFAELKSVRHAAQLLWNRGVQEIQHLSAFVNPQFVQPASPFEFGQQMQQAVNRLQQARERQETVAIWGDFDADGITATAVLWDGLGQFFPQRLQRDNPPGQLLYYIPNRLSESHGLNQAGIERLAQTGTTLIITCDTGSTNLAEVEYARNLGIDVIITDHHTLPSQPPAVSAIINPRYLDEQHPLYHLSGVAVAYKLVEALYQSLPDIPQQPLSDLLDLVAIGLIADLVQLKGDCRYLAQLGIQRLQADFQKPAAARRRPGIGRLLELCQKNGDRPTDISFGLGPRINAVSRIQGDASFCVELLTSRDLKRCSQLAEAAELANARRKAIQKEVIQDVKAQLAQLDLSTTRAIVLADSQWPAGILGLVASQIAQEYGRPTLLLSTSEIEANTGHRLETPPLARGSARSVGSIDLYQLVKSQEHLLHRFGGHPLAAGLSLPIENLPVFSEAINQQLSNDPEGGVHLAPQADLRVTVAELGKDLFRELRILEPCGMGNPVPKLLIENCRFANVWNKNMTDLRGKKVSYIKTEFMLFDDSTEEGIRGMWWGHYKEDIPAGECDAIVELDYNPVRSSYEVRLVAVRQSDRVSLQDVPPTLEILDWREQTRQAELLPLLNCIRVQETPLSWDDLQAEFRLAQQQQKPLALAYPPPTPTSPQQVWQQLLGLAKYLSRTGKSATRQQLEEKLGISSSTLELGLQALKDLGIAIAPTDEISQSLQMQWSVIQSNPEFSVSLSQFLAAIQEEKFRRQYFFEVPVKAIQAIANQAVI
ncbi:MAG: single-stranded-DNA-specific exonuclease RecJ [Desertifilum sp.]|nr:single-stranded-DNA-specific exonuclease RecJ [Desertifilum sp.]